MATRSLVPREDQEGGLGASVKRWFEGWFINLHCTNIFKNGVELQDLLDEKVGPIHTHPGLIDPGAMIYRLVIGATVCYENNTAVSKTSTTYTVSKTMPEVPSDRSGMIRVYYTISRSGNGQYYARLTKNGTPIKESEIMGHVATSIENTIDIGVESGDVISIEVKNTTAGQSVVTGLVRITAELVVPTLVSDQTW